MASLQDTWDMLLYAFSDGVFDSQEFISLYDMNKSRNPPFPYWNYERFDLEKLTEAECKAYFRFEKDDIAVLANCLQLPEKFTCSQGTVIVGTEGLCMLLRRFSYPCRFSDMLPLFGRPVPELSMITSVVMDYIFDTHGHRLRHFDQPFLRPEALKTYCDAIYERGAALDNCWGFVDGTVRPICRPEKRQRCVYNGHKRVHAIKFQSVITPNGLIANLFGPIEGKRHDASMLRESNLLTNMEQFSFCPRGTPLCIYGDPAYPIRAHLQTPFRNIHLTPQMGAYNKAMSTVRVSVEWIFGDIVNYFKFLDYKKNLKIGLSAVGKMYIVCALLHNAKPCLYGNLTSKFFDLEPPRINEYFDN